MTPPTFIDCPQENVVIDQLTAPGIPTPQPQDNSGAIRTLTVAPEFFTTAIVWKVDQTVTYTATDHAGNVGECSFLIRVKGLFWL